MTSPALAGVPSLKVPKENNRYLCFPKASDSKQLIDRNRLILLDRHLPIWFQELRLLARKQALNSAKEYMVGYAPSLAESVLDGDLFEKPWVLGGHQPELFHSGVWFKNFLLAEIGKQTDSVGFQVIIDHDVARSDTLRLPCIAKSFDHVPSLLSLRSIPLPMRKELAPRMPWHATTNEASDPDAWCATIDSVGRSMADCGLAPPLLLSRQSLLEECIAATKNIGDAFSQFRHRIEMQHGVFNLEVPIGRLCDASAFGLFVHHCVANAESLWSTYNECRDAYRARHKIRNQGQPVMELQKWGNWHELPFWIYRRSGSNVVRNRLWVCKQKDEHLLSDSYDPIKRTVSVDLSHDHCDLAESWAGMVEGGVCIRPRALMTTMYLRCFVGDLFVHGIGGGTYDELTDDILSQWLGVTPPTYLISSASLYLPFRSQAEMKNSDSSSNWTSIQRELHLMRSVPERFLDQSSESQRALFEAHAYQLANIPPRGNKLQWHQQTVKLKQQIEIEIEPKKQSLLAKMESTQRDIQQSKILNSREYSFVLFEEQDVVGRLVKLAQAACNQPSDASSRRHSVV